MHFALLALFALNMTQVTLADDLKTHWANVLSDFDLEVQDEPFDCKKIKNAILTETYGIAYLNEYGIPEDTVADKSFISTDVPLYRTAINGTHAYLSARNYNDAVHVIMQIC